MPYSLTLPNGFIVEDIPDNIPRDQAMGMLEEKMPDAFPGVMEQIVGLPGEVAKGFVRGLTVDPLSGIASLGYTGARAAGAELTPFEQTAFGKRLGEAQEYLAPDYGTISQFGGGLGSMLSFIPGGLMKGGIGLATRLTQAGAVGSEEARARAEEARLLGEAQPTAGEQFAAQLGGVGVGFSELAPVERLIRPVQAVLRGVPASKADEIAPGLFNSAKRMLETGGIEGVQEGMANIAQDLIAKGIYNPDLEVGESALGDAAMGASIGAFAQGAIDFITRGKRRDIYEQLKSEEREAETQRRIDELAAQEQERLSRAQEGLGFTEALRERQEVLRLPAPSATVVETPAPDPLLNPLGNFTPDELTPEVAQELNNRRKAAGLPELESFSIEDLADLDAPQAQIDAFISNRLSQQGIDVGQELQTRLNANTVLGFAQSKGVDTNTVGFQDFLRRTTGSDNLNKMSPVQRLAAAKALEQTPEGTNILPPGTNATRFSDTQYGNAIGKVKKTFPDTDRLSRTSVIEDIKKASGLKNDRDAEALLNSALQRGDLTTISEPVFDVYQGDKLYRRFNSRQTAEEQAGKLGFGARVQEATRTQIGLPGDLKELPGGPDIRKGTFQEGTAFSAFDVTDGSKTLASATTLEDAEKKATNLTAQRQRIAGKKQEELEALQGQLANTQNKVEEMEATGQAGTSAYIKAVADAKRRETLLQSKIEELTKEVSSLMDPVAINGRGQKPVTREGYTLFDGETPVGTFPDQQTAEQAAIARYDDAMLERIAETGDRQRGLMPKRLAQLARDELARRRGQGPQGFGVTIESRPGERFPDRDAALERLEASGIYTQRVQEQIKQLNDKLMPVLRKLGLENVGLRIVRSIQNGGADGFYAQRLITIAMDAPDPIGTLRHEGIHALKELGAFTQNEWRVLENKAKSEWIDRFLKDRRTADGQTLFDAYKAIYQQDNGSLTGFDAYIMEEAIADAFKYFNQNKKPAGLVGNLMDRIKKFFDALENAFKGLGFQTADDIFVRTEEGLLQPIREESAAGVGRAQLREGQSGNIETTGDKRPFNIEQARIYERELEALVKRVGDRIAGMDSQKTLSDVKAAIKKLQDYAKRGIEGKEWYERSAKAVLEQFNNDPVLAEKFFQLIAITSAGTEVKANFTKASKAWEQFATGQKIKVGTGRENEAIEALLYFGEDWSGRKTNTFYQNLMEAMEGTDTGRSTIDLHMARMLFDRDAPTDAQYGLAENMIRLLASKTGIPARQIQAASWVTQKAKGIFEDYRKRGLKKGMTDQELRNHAFQMAIIDYAHLIEARGTPPTVTPALREPSESIRARVQTATGEVIPSTAGAMSQVAEMPYANKEQLNKDIFKAKTVQKIADVLGLKSTIRVVMGKGGYDQSISPNLIVQVVNPNPQQAYQDSLDLTDAMSFVFQQDATPFFRADPALIDSGQLGYKFRFKRAKLTDAQDRKLFRALIEEIGNDAGFTKTRDNEYVLINYRDSETGQPFGLSDPDFMQAVARFRDKANQITEVEDATAFGAESEYRYNDWSDAGTGDALLAGIQDRRADRPNLSGGLTDLRKSFVGQARDAVRATGVTPRFSLRSPESSGGPGTGSGIVLGQSRQPNAATFTGVHYGKSQVSSLSGSFYGTGIKGAEAKRLAESNDPRIKRRVYFYIPNDATGRMPKPEAGLGQYVYQQTFDNILPPGEEMSRIFADAGRDANAFESAVLDAGYDGYAIPSMSMMVIMDKNVPAEYLGTRSELRDTVNIDGQRFSLRATDTPEFKQWFGDSKITTEDGTPKVMYHGTARDITEFRPKQANAIFVTENPKFAEGFTGSSETFMAREMFDNADPEQRNEWVREAVRRSLADGSINRATANNIESNLRSGEPVTYQTIPVEVEVDAIDVLLENLPSKANIMPLYVSSENPFDFNNPEDVDYVVDYIQENHAGEEISGETDIEDIRARLSAGSWIMVEHPLIQEAIRANGHDGFYVREGGQKNLAVYEPSQVKSAIGNIGTFSRNSKDIRFSLALGSLEPTTALIPDRGGNASGNLGMMPEQFDGKPIRMLIGTHDDIKDKGYGANHILARIMADPRRAPGGSEELLERVLLSAQKSAQSYTRIYQEGSRPILYDGTNVMVLSPERDQYSIITMYAMTNPDSKFGRPVWQGRAVSILPEEARGLQVEARLGRVAAKPVDIKAKKVYSPAEIAKLAEEMPMAAFVQPTKKGTLSLKKKPEAEPVAQEEPRRLSIRESIDPTIVDSIEKTTTTRQNQGFGDRMAEALSPTSFTKLRQGFINRYERIEQYTRAVAKQFGNQELLAENSAIAAALMSDRASGVAAEAFKRGIPVYDKGYTFVDDKGGEVKGLMEILLPLAKYKDPFVFQAFQYYAAAKRGKRLDREGREQVFTKVEQDKAALLARQFPEFEQVMDEYQKFNAGLVKYMVDTGVISKEMGQKWTENWDYIPFYRQLEGEVTQGPNVFQAIAGVVAPKKLKGGSAPLADFMETVVRNTRAAIEAGMKNVAAQRVARDMMRLNDPSGTAKMAERLGPGDKSGGADVITVREEGKDVRYRVADPLLVESLKGLNMPHFPFLDILAKPAQLLRELVTKDPGFMMANLLRDSLQAWGTGQQITPITDTFKQYGKVLANMSPEAQKLMRAGVGTGYEFKGDVQASSEEFAKQLRMMAGDRTFTESAMLLPSKMWDMLDRASTASDLATRAEVFKRTLEDTGSEAEAVFQAIEVMNFSRKGSNPIMQIAAASIPFLNARVQGLDVLYRAGFGKLADKNNAARQKAFWVRGATLMGLSSLYWMLASESEEWRTAEPEARDNHWIIPIAGVEGGVRIPIPFELGVIFKVAPERALEYFFGDDTAKDLKQSFVRNLTSTLAVNPIPQAVLPIFENYVNYSFFTGQPIVGRGLEDVDKPYQINTATSMFAKKAGETLGLSPVQIDNLIRGYTGTIGGYAVMAMDSIFRGQGDPTKAEMRAEQLPVIKRFFASPQGTGTMTQYYELKKAVDESVRTINFLERGGRVNEMAEYMKDNAMLISITPYVRSLDKEITMLRDMKRVINNSQMEASQKRDALDAIRLAEVNMTRHVQQLKKAVD